MKYLAAECQLDAHDLKCSIGNWETYSRATGRSGLLVKKMLSIPVLSTTKFKQLVSNGFINFIWIRIKTNPFIFQLKICSEEKFIVLLLSPQRNPSGKDGNIWRSWLRVKVLQLYSWCTAKHIEGLIFPVLEKVFGDILLSQNFL